MSPVKTKVSGEDDVRIDTPEKEAGAELQQEVTLTGSQECFTEQRVVGASKWFYLLMTDSYALALLIVETQKLHCSSISEEVSPNSSLCVN